MSNKPCTLCVGCGRCETFQADIEILTKGGLPSELATFPCDDFKRVFTQGEMLVSVDIGTTTVAMTLRRLLDGEIVDIYTALNPQSRYGRDVISRMEQKDFAIQMQKLIEETIWQGICQMMEAYAKQNEAIGLKQGNETNRKQMDVQCLKQIKGMVIAGNTTMLYLLRGRDTEELSKAPFHASFLEQEVFDFHSIKTIVMPGISAFVGADVLAGMFALSMWEGIDKNVEEPANRLKTESKVGTLLVDLGTNGEMVLKTETGFVATATPAAPAYEGGSFGEQIYGADYVSLLAYLLEQGYMDETGLLADPYFEEGILVAGKRITQQDIRRLQLAKGATRAGVQILTKDKPVSVVYLAGGFGYHLDGSKAEYIGLLPEGFRSKVVTVGNLALEGAFLYGRYHFSTEAEEQEQLSDMTSNDVEDDYNLAQRATKRLEKMKERTKVLNLAMEPDFEKVYLESISFPYPF